MTKAHDFIEQYSKLEFAITFIGYAKRLPNKKVGVDWAKFATVFPEGLDVAEANGFAVLVNAPPSEPVFDDKCLFDRWLLPNEVPRVTTWEQLFLKSLSTLRNNIAHGNKFYKDDNRDDKRNEKLLEAGISLIKYIKTKNIEYNGGFLNELMDDASF